MTSTLIPRGFWLAGLTNILGVLVFSLGFTNRYLMELYPEVFSPVGLIVIILWGLAYIAVARSYSHVRPLIGVFIVEKFVYTMTWLLWLLAHGSELPDIMERSLFTGILYAIYGVHDLIFGLFFAWVFWRQR